PAPRTPPSPPPRRSSALLRAKGGTRPHQLYLSATPIPRSVAMTVFGDVEVSTRRELPAGRSGVSTYLAPASQEKWMQRIWARDRDRKSTRLNSSHVSISY